MYLRVSHILSTRWLLMLMYVNSTYAFSPGGPRDSFKRFRTLDSYWASSGFLQEVPGSSTIACSTECVQEPQCVSFFYDFKKRICQLHAFKYETRTSLVTGQTTQYYSMRDVIAPTNYTCIDAPPDPSYSTVVMTDGTLLKYRIGWENVTQNQAQLICQSEGGALLRILSTTKMKTIGDILTSCNGYYYEFWTDGTNINAADPYDITQWETSLGEPFPTEPSLSDFWYDQEPFDPAFDHCVSIYGGIDDFNVWISWPCDYEYFYICEK